LRRSPIRVCEERFGAADEKRRGLTGPEVGVGSEAFISLPCQIDQEFLVPLLSENGRRDTPLDSPSPRF
jgi:hypothetical protein